jgi:dipeptidyl aminopeptidase/acylaminoacyl peptidase
MHRSMLLWVSLVFATAAGAQTPAPAAETAPARQFTAEKMWALKRLGDPAISPDGATAVVPVTTYDLTENKGFTDLWLLPVAGGPARQLTSDKASDTQPTVSPDGKWIAFVSKRGDDTESQVYAIAIDGGEARRVTNVPTGASVPKWFPDSARIAFISEVWPDLRPRRRLGYRAAPRRNAPRPATAWSGR